MAVTYTYCEQTGTHTVSRTFKSAAATWACAKAMELIVEAAYTPQPFPPVETVRELSPATEARIDHDEAADDPEPASAMGLNVATAGFPVSQSTGD